MGFRFRKIYADLVTADQTVCIAYLAWLDAWGIRTALGGVELYSPDGGREVLRALPPASRPPPGGDGGPVELRLDFPAGALSIRYDPVHEPWTPLGQPAAPALEWSVRVPRAAVTGRWTGAPGRDELIGTGYMDWLEITRPTRSLGIRDLEWGRVHLPDGTLVFTGVRSRAGEWWRRVAYWPGPGRARPVVGEDFRLVQRPDGFQLDALHRDGNCSAFSLDRGRVLHRGGAVDRARAPGLVERLALRLVTGPSTETRRVSRALSSDRSPSAAGSAVHEVVRFGR